MGIGIVDAGSVLRSVSKASVLTKTGLQALTVKALTADGLKIITGSAPALSVAATPDQVNGAGNSPTVTTGTTQATPTGGTAPYSYAWTRTGGTAQATAASNATTAFRQSGMVPGQSSTSTFTCTVTDANGQSAVASVTAVFLRIDGIN